ncbi:MAG: ABC transporter permease [Planctomycetes bacterium]|nr:ABC transporter permease [Planctomycetota bacterium]MCW8134227.1 ABC transporter permease [Planctomycetota bacterium]
MLAYVLRKLLYMPLILMGVIVITFILFFLVTSPEALARHRVGEKASQQQVLEWMAVNGYIEWTDAGRAKREAELERTEDEFDKELGKSFDDGVDYKRTSSLILFGRYIRDIARFDYGMDRRDRPVTRVLYEGMWASLALTLPAFLIAELLGVFFGLIAAMYRQTKIDHVLVISAILIASINNIALYMYGQKFLAAEWNYFPVSGYGDGFNAVRYLMLPILLYVFISYGDQLRFNRIVMLDETNQDYVRTARAKGLNENSVLFKHVLRNTLIPLITRWVVAIPTLYLGALVLESFFGIPGLGYLTVDAIANSDVNIVRATVVLGSITFMLANLLSDVLYAVADPRVKLS